MYTFMVNPHELLEVAYVARRETRNERFYQRIVNKEKLKKIAEYVDDNNLLPNNLILAFGEHLRRFIKFHVQDKDYLGRCTSGIYKVRNSVTGYFRFHWHISLQFRWIYSLRVCLLELQFPNQC